MCVLGVGLLARGHYTCACGHTSKVLVKPVSIIHILWTEQVKCVKFSRNIEENEQRQWHFNQNDRPCKEKRKKKNSIVDRGVSFIRNIFLRNPRPSQWRRRMEACLHVKVKFKEERGEEMHARWRRRKLSLFWFVFDVRVGVFLCDKTIARWLAASASIYVTIQLAEESNNRGDPCERSCHISKNVITKCKFSLKCQNYNDEVDGSISQCCVLLILFKYNGPSFHIRDIQPQLRTVII